MAAVSPASQSGEPIAINANGYPISAEKNVKNSANDFIRLRLHGYH